MRTLPFETRPTLMRLLVCGGRDYADRLRVWRTLHIYAALAEKERALISERTKTALAE